MQAVVYNESGAESGKIALDAGLFAGKINPGLVHRLLLLQHANARIAIAHTLGRGEIRGSTRKLYAQKGTGRARVGDSRSPTRKGGGVTFGPTNARNFTIMMNKKERRAALISILSTKATEKQIKVLENFAPKNTKAMTELFTAIEAPNAVLAVTPNDLELFRTGRNIPTVKVIGANYLNPHDLLKYKNLVFTKASLEFALAHFAK